MPPSSPDSAAAGEVGATSPGRGVKPSPPLVSAAWLSGSRLAVDALGFLVFLAISRRFGPAATGRYSYAFALAGIGYVVASLGLADYGVREYARLAGEARQRVLSTLLATQAAAVGLVAVGFAGYLLLSRPDAETAVLVVLLTASQLGLAAARVLLVPAFAHQAMAAPAVAELACRGTASLVAAGLIGIAGVSLPVALLAYPAAALLMLGFAAGSAARHGARLAPRLRRGDGGALDTARAAWPFAASEIVYQVYARADVIMLTLLAGAAAAGIYASGLKFVEVAASPVLFVGVAAFPGLSRLFDRDPAGFTAAGAKLLRWTLTLGGLIAWGLVFVVPLVLVPALGHRFEEATRVVRLMAALALLAGVQTTATRILLAARRQVGRLKIQLIGAGLKIGLNAALIPVLGIEGAVAASLAALLCLDVLYLGAVLDWFPRPKLTRPLGAFGITVAGSAGVAGALLLAGLGQPVAALASLVVLVVSSVATGLAPLPAALPIRRRGAAGEPG